VLETKRAITYLVALAFASAIRAGGPREGPKVMRLNSADNRVGCRTRDHDRFQGESKAVRGFCAGAALINRCPAVRVALIVEYAIRLGSSGRKHPQRTLEVGASGHKLDRPQAQPLKPRLNPGSIAHGHDDHSVWVQGFLRHAAHVSNSHSLNLFGQGTIVVERQPRRRIAALVCTIPEVLSKFPGSERSQSDFAMSISAALTGVSRIFVTSFKSSSVAGAVASVRIDPPAENGPGPRR
jgi:hypothetical protein